MTKLQKTCINWMLENYGGKWLCAPHYERLLRQWHVCTTFFEDYVRVEIASTSKGPFVKMIGLYSKKNR